ncbi:beta-3-deoxy-D-manno-oct-2-ulosonic acid transferase [Sphingomonas mucosissima]|uniref:Capsule polysaccharide biosynthesis protein n=1 Tax=Sphingomonas mucosissima TaxID=370959 RepID=A0A245ZT62_9SPHN|nr:beta-3-deoxy-D-manno-oct-2-ulosonic acid transferase [Sphingomonas mucosissima]OWK32934.1 capsule polysaccharide biosynthesis protein [Sphingomonas mucosissima]
MVDRGWRARARGLIESEEDLVVVEATAPLLLRSPPFPWVGEKVAAVSLPGGSRLADPERLFAAMRQTGVGGAFWLPAAERAGAEGPNEQGILRWIAGDPGGPDRRAEAISAVEAASYRNPFTGAPCDAHDAVKVLEDWRDLLCANRRIAAAVGMSAWKRDAIGRLLWDGARRPAFLSADHALSTATAGEAIVYWPSRAPADFPARAARQGVEAWQVEDGFLRSSGLGAECRPPWSIMVDRSGGIHYDPNSPSEIERLLATHAFEEPLLRRARALREQIVAARLCKYGVDDGAAPPALPAGKRIALAIGQVADDLAVSRSGETRMAGFLKAVREREPGAFIIYRPHPDVLAGLRNGDVPRPSEVDLIVAGGSLLALLDKVQAVHVWSSLTGFEALMRDVEVTVHGTPFYAGWGLTHDLAPIPSRRRRQLPLDALVAAALILAPRYLDPLTGLPCSPEVLVQRLAKMAKPAYNALTGFRRAYGAARVAARQVVKGRL